MDITENMPPALARQLFEKGAFLIIAGVPEKTEFGIDLCSYSVGEKFRGVKMIPAGPHFVYTAAQGPYGDTASRIGFIHYFKSQEIVIREWDNEKEELRQRTSGNEDEEVTRIRCNLRELDSYLAPYDFSSLAKWNNLTNHMTEMTINRCLPECGLIRPSVEFESCSNEERPKGNTIATGQRINRLANDEDELLPKLKIVPETAPRFTQLPELYPKHLTTQEISLAHMDAILAVDQLFSQFPESNHLLDEIQFSFVLYLAGYSTDSLAHWRRILGILANSEAGVKKNNKFYREYLDVMQYQLPELPEELMEPTPRNTVYRDVRNLVKNCSLCDLDKEADYLMANLSQEMGWTFDGLLSEDPDDLPVVVEM
ncbi:protein AAR2 homolog [Bradysia coprophila]|uniref:protein AAR2 homolog n=1 Tax=Bradysia coprophila TaxID=38358 RepID=UPI00187D8A01|nr:protein AAR2 homolog [Bradysia coprophila]